MNKITIVSLIGLPGSGKTTFCHNFKTFCKGHVQKINIIHVCLDDLVQIDQSLIDSGLFKEIRQYFVELVRILVKSIHSQDFTELEKLLKEKFTKNVENVMKIKSDFITKTYETPKYCILVDDNNYYRSMRYCFYQIARMEKASYGQIYFDIDPNVAIQRNLNREQVVDKKIIESMSVKMEKPSDINDWEKKTFIVNSKIEVNFDSVLEYLMEASLVIEAPIQDKTPKIPFNQSEIHKIDLLIRKVIHNEITQSQCDKVHKEIMAKNLQAKRKALLKDIREGIIFFDINISDEMKSRIIRKLLF